MTIGPRWRKVLRDIGGTPLRTALAVLAMAAGAFGVTMILTAYSVLSRELAATYSGTRPASAILYSSGIDDSLVASVRRLPGVLDAEARPVIHGRVLVGKDEWRPLVLFVVRDFSDLRIDKFSRNSGAWPPKRDEVLIERSGLSVARASRGDRITIRTKDGVERSLLVSGSVHAPGLAPGWMDHVVSGFVAWDSVVRIAPGSEASELRIVVAENALDERHIRDVAGRVSSLLESAGHKVSWVQVPPPGRHPHADQMDTFLFILGAFGGLTLVLSGVLVTNMIHALLIEQVRQVGIMKAIGASTSQIARLYLGQIAILAATSLSVGVPLGLAAGGAYVQWAGAMLNATIASTAVPFRYLAAEVAIGLLVPLVVGFLPVYRASRVTIHEALNEAVGRRPFGSQWFDRQLAKVGGLPRPLLLSLRTGFSRRGRLLLTLITLAAGGAVFISALSVSSAWNRLLAGDARTRRDDIAVRLLDAYPVAGLASALAALPEIEQAEYWVETPATLIKSAGGAATDGHGGDLVGLVGPPDGSKLFAPTILEGRWLGAGDRDVVVINQALARDPALHVGGSIALNVEGRSTLWHVIGVVREIAPGGIAYAPADAVLAAMGQPAGTARTIRVVTQRHDPASVLSASREIELTLRAAGFGVRDLQLLGDLRKAFEDHLVIIRSALILAAALVILVGGLGLTSTLTLNVIERTREIGILGAIGASPASIAQNVVFEGVLLGALSWCVAVALALPVSFELERLTGQIFIRTSLDFFLSPAAAAVWLLLVILLATLSSLYPAWRATRFTVREALAHE